MAIPNYYYRSVRQVTPAWLAERGLSAVIVDLDNTILPRYTDEIPADICAWAAALIEARVPVALLSNNHRKRVAAYAKRLGFTPLSGAVKPLPFAYLRALRRLATPRRKVVMIGDQLFTDICGAAFLGITNVMVLPLSQRDLAHTLLLRKLEAVCMRHRCAE
ncbi:MAG: YqeG family HAD IIIA-type phosphatase [Actinomycetia bacterium]|nr:YqeG family HAD IIIA-type phosphatase [Actinomycetes bacterium]